MIVSRSNESHDAGTIVMCVLLRHEGAPMPTVAAVNADEASSFDQAEEVAAVPIPANTSTLTRGM